MVPASESSAIRFGLRTIAFTVRRSARRQTLSIAVDARDGVTVAAPLGLGLPAIERLVAGRARWIVEAQRRFEDVEPGPPPRGFKTGETFRYLGKQYRLRIAAPVRLSHQRSRPAVKLLGGWLTVELPAATVTKDHRQAARRALVAWYRRRAAELLPQRVARWSAKLASQHRRSSSASREPGGGAVTPAATYASTGGSSRPPARSSTTSSPTSWST